MYLQKLGQLQRNGLLGNLGMGSASGAEQMMAMGQQLAQMGGSNNQLERMKQMSQQSADQAMQMEKQRQAQQGSGLGKLFSYGLAAATGGISGLASAVGGDIVSEITGSPILGMIAGAGIGKGLKGGKAASNTAGNNITGDMAKEQMNSTMFSDKAVTDAALKANDSKYLFDAKRLAKPVGYNPSMNWRNQSYGVSAPYFPM